MGCLALGKQREWLRKRLPTGCHLQRTPPVFERGQRFRDVAETTKADGWHGHCGRACMASPGTVVLRRTYDSGWGEGRGARAYARAPFFFSETLG